MKKQLSLILMICILFSTATIHNQAAVAEDWQTEPFMLESKAHMSSETIGNNIYLIGGLNKASLLSVDIFYTNTKTWSKGKNLPSTLSHRASAVYNNEIYVFGGDYNGVSQGNVDIYNPVSDAWSVGRAIPYPVRTASAITIGNEIYVFGGDTTDKKNYIQIYDPVNNSWTTTSMPFANMAFSLHYYNERVYMIGGYDGNQNLGDVYIYSINTNEWSKGTNMPIKKNGAASVMLGNKIYIIGGGITGPDGKSIVSTDSVEVYNILDNSWTKEKSLKSVRYRPSAGIVNGRIFVFGGLKVDTSVFLDSVESLKIPDEPISDSEELQVLLYPDEQVQLGISFEIEENNSFLWSSINPEIASIDASGKVSALKTGSTEIWARNKANTYSERIFLKVIDNINDPRLAVQLKTGQSLRLYMGKDPHLVDWTSLDTSIAAISSEGHITGVSKGLAIIKAKLNESEKLLYVRVI